jgi:hypothetical protein
MTPSINDLADANLLESIREHARWQSPCELVEENGILMIAGATNFPGAYKNCVARIDRNVPAAELLERARDFFGSRQRGFTVFVRGRALRGTAPHTGCRVDQCRSVSGFGTRAGRNACLFRSSVAPACKTSGRLCCLSRRPAARHRPDHQKCGRRRGVLGRNRDRCATNGIGDGLHGSCDQRRFLARCNSRHLAGQPLR